MSLNKALCAKCRNEYKRTHPLYAYRKLTGAIQCPYDNTEFHARYEDEPPPPTCPYITEHTLLNDTPLPDEKKG